MTNPHPQTTTATLAGLAGALLAKEANERLGTHLDQTEAIAVVIGAVGAVLLVGRAGAKAIWHTGIVGIARHILYGPKS